MDTKKRIIDLTLGELMDAIDERIEAAAQKPEKPKTAKTLRVRFERACNSIRVFQDNRSTVEGFRAD